MTGTLYILDDPKFKLRSKGQDAIALKRNGSVIELVSPLADQLERTRIETDSKTEPQWKQGDSPTGSEVEVSDLDNILTRTVLGAGLSVKGIDPTFHASGKFQLNS